VKSNEEMVNQTNHKKNEVVKSKSNLETNFKILSEKVCHTTAMKQQMNQMKISNFFL
jgi:hypothetical protein